jgi:site-specific DNA recombinase
MRKPAPTGAKIFRCAVYTRKSSEEGLEQDFNSLHPSGSPARHI